MRHGAGKIVEETLNYLGVERRYSEKDLDRLQKRCMYRMWDKSISDQNFKAIGIAV